jgi:tRNA-uridine 2-sulfurtransferase
MNPDTPTTPRLRVAVGMSGGLDSSVVAALLQDEGHEVIGLTLHLFKEGSRCCSLEDVQRAQRVCDQLGIRHYTLNAVDYFDEAIIQPFVDEYARGRTPSPCVLCNQYIKFGILHTRAQQLGCTHVATGHYVRLQQQANGWHLFRGRDAKKDQSYFLHRLSQEQLSRSIFPLEGWSKDKVRAYGVERGLPVSITSKAESQDLCFITEAGPAPFVAARRPDVATPGAIRNLEGDELGTHRGIHAYTVGQRKGIGVASTAPLYVREIDPVTNTVFVGFRQQVQSSGCRVDDVHWIAGHPPATDEIYNVRLRYRHPGTPSRYQAIDDQSLALTFEAPQFGVAPGQAAVFYRDDEVLGGGWISAPVPVDAAVAAGSPA